MTTFLSISRTEDGAINLQVDTSLFGEPKVPSYIEPKAQVAPASPVKPKVAPKGRRISTAKAVQPKPLPKAASKPKASPKPKASSDKPVYGEIRRLTASGRHDEAIVLAEAEGWPHVVASIEAHRAKHGNKVAVVEPKAPVKKAPAKRQPKAVQPKRQPKAETCDKHIGVILTPLGCPICLEPKAPVKPKASKPKAPAKAKAPASKREAKRAIGASKAPVGNKPQAFPTNVVSEADLVLHWAALAAAGHLDVVSTAHQAVAGKFRTAVAEGDRREAQSQMKLLRSLDNLLRQAV